MKKKNLVPEKSSPTYFDTIANDAFSEKELTRIHDCWLGIRQEGGFSDKTTISRIIEQDQKSSGEYVSLASPYHERTGHLFTQTILSCIFLDKGDGLRSEAIEKALNTQIGEIQSKLLLHPISRIMNSINITDRPTRYRMTKELALTGFLSSPRYENIDYVNRPSQHIKLAHDAIRHFFCVDDGLDTEIKALSDLFYSGIVFDRSHDSIIARFSLVDDAHTLISYPWLDNLCSMALIGGVPPGVIVSNATAIMNVFAERYSLQTGSKEHTDFVRRTLVAIFLCNDELLTELRPIKHDLMPLKQEKNASLASDWPFRLLNISAYENAFRSLKSAGIEIDLDDVFDFAKHNIPKLGIDIFGFEASKHMDPDDFIRDIIGHPRFQTEDRISITRLTDRISPEISIDFMIASAKRTNKNLITTPQFLPSDQNAEDALLRIVKNGDMSLKVCRQLQFKPKLLHKYKKLMPREVVRHLLEDDLGL